MTDCGNNGGVLTEATELNAFSCEWLTFLEFFLRGWHCSRYWKKAEVKSSGGWRSRRSKKRLAGEVGGGVRRWWRFICVLQRSPPLPLGGLFLYPLPTCTPWASRNQASTVVLSQSFAEAPCPGLHAYLGIKPQMPTDTSQVSLVAKEGYCGELVLGGAENSTASCPSQ